MNDLQNTAIENFRSGLNCAQSVLTAFSDSYNIDKDTALMISCGLVQEWEGFRKPVELSRELIWL